MELELREDGELPGVSWLSCGERGSASPRRCSRWSAWRSGCMSAMESGSSHAAGHNLLETGWVHER